MKYTREENGYIRINTDGMSLVLTNDNVDIDISGYVLEPVIKDVKPMIPYLWTQHAPFNLDLPVFDNLKDKPQSPTGCTQIALAMIASYYGNIGINGKKFPKGVDKTAEYVSKKGTAYELTNPALPAATFNYSLFNLNTADDFKTDAQKAEIAKFLKHISHSNYASFGVSSTSCSLSRALAETINKRMHLAKKAVLIKAIDLGIEEFKKKIYDELVSGHPVLIATTGTRTENGKKTSLEHSFIVDGYRASDGKFHFNLGGNVAHNGWYDLENAVKKWNGIEWNWSHNINGELALQCIIKMHPEEF